MLFRRVWECIFDLGVDVILCLDQSVLQRLDDALAGEVILEVLLEDILAVTGAINVQVDRLLNVTLINYSKFTSKVIANIILEEHIPIFFDT